MSAQIIDDEHMTIEKLIALKDDPTVRKIIPPRVLVLHPVDFDRIKKNDKFSELEEYFEVVRYPAHIKYPHHPLAKENLYARPGKEQID